GQVLPDRVVVQGRGDDRSRQVRDRDRARQDGLVRQGRVMAGVGPLDLAGTVQAVAHILDGQPVEVIGLDGRKTYPHESVSAVVTVSVHLDGSTKADLAIAAAINAMVEAETSADT